MRESYLETLQTLNIAVITNRNSIGREVLRGQETAVPFTKLSNPFHPSTSQSLRSQRGSILFRRIRLWRLMRGNYCHFHSTIPKIQPYSSETIALCRWSLTVWVLQNRPLKYLAVSFSKDHQVSKRPQWTYHIGFPMSQLSLGSLTILCLQKTSLKSIGLRISKLARYSIIIHHRTMELCLQIIH